MRRLVILVILLITVSLLRAQNLNIDALKTLQQENVVFTVNVTEKPLPNFSVDLLNSIYDNSINSAGQLLSRFSLPGSGKIISRFGWRSGRKHTGTDIKMEKGDTICASYNGIVSRASYYYGYGNLVVLEHEKNIETYYAHLSAFLVKKGDTIRHGQPVGLAGSTGRATTNHLHFEIRENEKSYDPELVFDFENSQVRETVAKMENLSDLQKDLRKSGYSVNEPVTEHYTVRTGDSLWEISRRYRTSIQSICMLNNLSEQSVLQVGQILKLF